MAKQQATQEAVVHTSFKAMAADGLVKKTDLFKASPQDMVEDPNFNLRDYNDPEVQAQIEMFAKMYEKGEYVPPLICRVMDGKVTPVEGHCRRRGALLAIARGADIPFLEFYPFRGNEMERLKLMLRSGEGLKFKPLEVAMGYARMRNQGHDNKTIADSMQKTPSHVEQMLLLADAEADVHKLVKEGLVAATAAIEAVRKHGAKAGEVLSAMLDGQGKVSRGAVKGWAPPPKVVRTVVDGLDSVVSTLAKTSRRELAELEKLPADQIKGRTVAVDAAALLDLMRAHASVEEARRAADERKRAAQEAASQGSLDEVAE
jgi:ParB family transcriptional regulator, chromosome partitioning protein